MLTLSRYAAAATADAIILIRLRCWYNRLHVFVRLRRRRYFSPYADAAAPPLPPPRDAYVVAAAAMIARYCCHAAVALPCQPICHCHFFRHAADMLLILRLLLLAMLIWRCCHAAAMLRY